jgi:hypothetical protein
MRLRLRELLLFADKALLVPQVECHWLLAIFMTLLRKGKIYLDFFSSRLYSGRRWQRRAADSDSFTLLVRQWSQRASALVRKHRQPLRAYHAATN